jgi:hypothetical protein
MAVSLWKRNGTGSVWIMDNAGYQTRRLVGGTELSFWQGLGVPIQNMPAAWFDTIPVAG